MSSHHIVREKQEPALLLLGLNTFTEELLGQLLEWSPTVIATPPVAEQLHAYEIKIDLIIGDDHPEELQSDIKHIAQNGRTQTQAALEYLLSNEYKAVNIVADSTELTDIAPFAGNINLVLYCGSQKIYPVNSGFSKWKPAGEIIHILSVYLNLQTNGLEALGSDRYVTTTDGFIKLKFDNQLLFIAEEL